MLAEACARPIEDVVVETTPFAAFAVGVWFAQERAIEMRNLLWPVMGIGAHNCLYKDYYYYYRWGQSG